MANTVTASSEALQEAFSLASEILRNIELSELPLTNLCLKASRLARLLNDFEMQQTFEYEASGYPSELSGVPPDAWAAGGRAGRHYDHKDDKGAVSKRMYTTSTGELEGQLASSNSALAAAADPAISLSSANPTQYVHAPLGNFAERNRIVSSISDITRKLARSRGLIHRYVSDKYYGLRFSSIPSDVFARIRSRVDTTIGDSVPNSVKTLTAIYDNLASENPEDWSNAAHGCRRLLQDLADALFPPQQDRVIKEGNKDKNITID
jgi:hypothetical protein